MSKWAELIAKWVTTFSQTSLCRKVHLLISGGNGGNGICGSIEGRSTPLYCLMGNWMPISLKLTNRPKGL